VLGWYFSKTLGFIASTEGFTRVASCFDGPTAHGADDRLFAHLWMGLWIFGNSAGKTQLNAPRRLGQMLRFNLFDFWFRPKPFESECFYERLGALVVEGLSLG
jgi:hypothetical protein